MNKKFWQIVPLGDGYHFLGIKDSTYFWGSKGNGEDSNAKIVFNSKQEAEDYIKWNKDIIPHFENLTECKAEDFWVWNE